MHDLVVLSAESVAYYRDIVIIFEGIAVAAFFLVALVIAIMMGLLGRIFVKKSIGVLDENVKPLLSDVNQTTAQARGTTTYVAQAAVSPIIRAYGVVAGVRRAAGVITGLAGASTDDKLKK